MALPPEMILLIGISSGAGNAQHLLASASGATVRGGEQTEPGRPSVPFLLLYGTCRERRLDYLDERSVWESQHVTRATASDILIVTPPINTHLIVTRDDNHDFSVFISVVLNGEDEKYELQAEKKQMYLRASRGPLNRNVVQTEIS